ncbi:transcriptional activator domain protein [Deinococcus maricopensis DSM 21211]|uniref:Transcriptional activator domain protein n=1 Tax=Deinococcus maricopensis (strain DSM 21211 / LMG 22137 / NRRL B-23946 / LB-34) TaxID=709986 RepID=E8UAU1_DEIML|nr:transcriptional activator domain protein [Deinococcus maricopensis DSM 21211]
MRGAVARPRLLEALQSARILTVTAPAGYGKTTALAAHLADLGGACWLTLDVDDADPRVLAGGLALALAGLPGGERLSALLNADAAPLAVARAAAELLEDTDTLLVIDEAQHTQGTDALLLLRTLLPARVALLTRTPLRWPELTALTLRGEARALGAADLAFTVQEVQALLDANGVTTRPEDVRRAHALTEGWPIAVRFLVQAAGQGRLRTEDLRDLEGEAPQLGTLFEYLAQEVLGPLDPALKALLLRACVFEEVTPELLEEGLGEPDARARLDALADGGTFLTRAGDAYRAHPLLRAHLRAQVPEREARAVAAQGAAFFEGTGRWRRAMAAHLQAGNADAAARLLLARGEGWLAQGRVHLMERSLARLPAGIWAQETALYGLLGDVRRAQSRYADAVAAYVQAPELMGLLGRARVYLDTVQPALAEPLLARAEALGGDVRVLRAENALNAGRLADAVALAPELAESARYALRRGDLERALTVARAARAEVGGERAAGNHREALLLESFVLSVLGDPGGAEAVARAGLAEGERLDSPFVRSLARARLGHAHLAGGQLRAARAAYEGALAGAEAVAPRLQVEPLMGLAYLTAVGGEAAAYGARATEAAQASGDRYMTGLARLTTALGALEAGQDAAAALEDARADFAACGDAFGVACVTLALFVAGRADARSAVASVRAYPFLLAHPSLLAPARTVAGRAAVLSRLRGAVLEAGERWDLAGVEAALGYDRGVPLGHPGWTVDVQVLGRVGARVNGAEPRDWGRAKARDLLALLAVHPDGLAREAAQEALFPDADPAVGERNFRVTLHALGQVLEAGAPGGFFLDRGDWVRLRVGPDLHVDLHAAWATLRAAPGTSGRAAALLALPGGVASVPLAAVEDVAAQYAARLPEAIAEEGAYALAHGRAPDAARLAEHALTLDAASEPAARVLMRARYALGNVAGVQRAYAACAAALRELGLTPLPETAALHRALTSFAP